MSANDTQQDNNATTSTLRTTHPELYGRLLSANTRLDEVGTWQIWIFTLIALCLCLCVQQGWGSQLLNIDLQAYRSWFLYLAICITCFIINGQLMDAREGMLYEQLKGSLHMSVDQSKLDRGHLLSLISEDEKLERISEFLQKDADFIAPRS